MPVTVAVVSARPDGATSVATALATYFSARARTLLIDLNVERPEVAPLLDLPETHTVYHLAYAAQLAPVTHHELEEAVTWHEGLAVLPGIAKAGDADEIHTHFVTSLLEAAARRFDRVVLDLGRARPDLLPAGHRFLWVVAPTRLGLAAFERCWRQLEAEQTGWLDRVKVVLNHAGGNALRGVAAFIERDYRLEVVAELPSAPQVWQQVELTRSLQALAVAVGDGDVFRRTYGEEAEAFRAALSVLAERLATPAPAATGARA